MNRITINGKTITTHGSSIVVNNGTVTVDGKVVADGLAGIVEIRWEGDLASLRSEASVTCRNVQGDVDAGGSITCGAVAGSVMAGGSVSVNGPVTGKIKAGGSVSHR